MLQVHVSMGSRVAAILDSSAISELQSRFLDYANVGNLQGALIFVAQQLRSDLRGITPATIMLIVTMVT